VTAAVTVTALTGRGLVRTGNEDRIGVFGWLAPLETSGPVIIQQWVTEPLVVAVADGMGGHLAGEVASLIAVTELMAGSADLVDEDALCRRYLDIHAAVLAAAHDHPDREGMGTTLSSVVVLPDSVLVANVGDSRVYYVEPGLVDLLTEDDVDPLAGGALTQVLGGRADLPMTPWTSTLPLADGLRLLLCTDGVHGVMGTETLRELVTEPSHPAAAHGLSKAAHDAGAPDNVSLCLVDITLPKPPEADDE
jgi:serine/threonine protein phosphatase PrpC